METAKDKAKSLVEKYQKSELLKDYDGMWDLLAIECAKIAVDEIIEQWEYIDTYLSDMGGKLNPNLIYWQEIKNELNKM